MAHSYLTVDKGAPVDQIESASGAGFDAVGLRLLAPMVSNSHTKLLATKRKFARFAVREV